MKSSRSPAQHVSCNTASECVPDGAIQQPTEAFVLLPELHRPGGSSSSIGVFRCTSSGRKYIGKGEYLQDTATQLREVLREMSSNSVYAFFGCHAQRLVLSEQPWVLSSSCWQRGRDGVYTATAPPVDGSCVCSLPCHHAASCDGTHDPDPVELCGAASGPHLMMQWIDGFRPFTADLIRQLISGESSTQHVTVEHEGYVLPVQGLGHIMAVAVLVNDIDCLGNAGANVGYTVLRDVENVPVAARAIKIDPGYAFTACDPALDMSSSEHEGLLASALDAVKSGVVQLGTTTTVSFHTLCGSVRSEFLGAVVAIAETSNDEFRAFFTSSVYSPLFPTAGHVEARVQFLAARRDAMATTYMTALPVDYQCSALRDSAAVLAALRARYSDNAVIRDPLTQSSYPLDDQYVNLCILSSKQGAAVGEGGGDREAVGAAATKASTERAGLVNSFEAIRAHKTATSIREVMDSCHGPTKRVNVFGGAGIGKSTFCQCIANSWAKGELFHEFAMVLLVPLRHLTSDSYPSGDEYSVADIIIRECLGVHPSPLLRKVVAHQYHAAPVLWILDGYDEVLGHEPEHLLQLLHHMLMAPHRILTGRPAAIATLAVCDVQVEVAGFTDRDIPEFVEQFVAIHTTSDEFSGFKRQSSDILGFLRDNRLVWDLAHVPINLVLLCHVLLEDAAMLTRGRQSTLTELYVRVERLLLRRFCVRNGMDVARMTAAEVAAASTSLCACVSAVGFHAMKAGVVMIPGRTVRDAVESCGLPVDASCWDMLSSSGLIMQAGAGHTGGFEHKPEMEHYHFLHLTLQEYFAAKRVCAGLMGTHVLGVEDVDWLQEHKDSMRLEVMWWFVAGLLGQYLRFGDRDAQYVILFLSL